RFSPKEPSGRGRPNSWAQKSSSSREKAYTALSAPPWCLSSPMKSPATPEPSPYFGPGADTEMDSTAALSIPVWLEVPAAVSRTTAILVERTRGELMQPLNHRALKNTVV